MINNFDLITPLLEFPNNDNFYFVQILQRKKDHPGIRIGGSNNNSRLIKTYYITSIEKLFAHQEEMIKLADVFGARVGINLNPRSFEKTAFQLLQKIANQMQNKNFYDIRKSYDSVCGNYHSEIDKRWLVDVDKGDWNIEARLAWITNTINDLHATIENREYKILATLPTRNGYHIITNPFNIDSFNKQIHGVEIHKNNPTLLYCPDL